ncbi:hypothetical protein [Mycobacterium sp.]|uniref:hypothetical protein n=1 Tax=Mycobacterium sp. TaxID=1785 RepID=UPI002DB17D71|nr:hypothetical protein [Mycobacterium sp.]
MRDKHGMGGRDFALGDGSAVLVEFVCMAKHEADPVNADGHTLALRGQLNAYCARGADENHAWVRVPPTPLGEITTGVMEERPPEPARPRHRVAQPS